MACGNGSCTVSATWVNVGPLPVSTLKPTVAVEGTTGPCLIRKVTITPENGAWIAPLPPAIWTAVHRLLEQRPVGLGVRLEPIVVAACAAGPPIINSAGTTTVAARRVT